VGVTISSMLRVEIKLLTSLSSSGITLLTTLYHSPL